MHITCLHACVSGLYKSPRLDTSTEPQAKLTTGSNKEYLYLPHTGVANVRLLLELGKNIGMHKDGWGSHKVSKLAIGYKKRQSGYCSWLQIAKLAMQYV